MTPTPASIGKVLHQNRRSRPSKPNRPAAKNDRVEGSLDPGETDLPDGLEFTRLTARSGTRLRESCAIESDDRPGEHRSAYLLDAISAWREWIRDYRDAHLRFERDDETVRVPLENSFTPSYGDRYYARFKGLEREFVRLADDPHTAMLTFSGSTENADGGHRCPVDHLTDVLDPWAAGVKQELHRVMDDLGHHWEYARILEPHGSGYGHVHVALYIDGEVSAEDFAPVLSKHVEKCQIAASDAHTIENAVSVSRVDPDADPTAEDGPISNLGTYLCEYLGTYGDDPLDQPDEQQMFNTVVWAANRRRLAFSNGAQELIANDRRRRRREDTGTRPEDRGEVVIDPEAETIETPDEWCVRLVRVDPGGPEEYPAAGGSVDLETITADTGHDPPPARS